MSLKLPSTKVGVDSWHMDLLPELRTSALELPEKIVEKYTYAIVLPKQSKLVSKLVDINKQNSVGRLVIKISQSETLVTIVKEIEFEKKTIELDDYESFKEIMDIWNNENYNNLIFKTE